MDKFEQLQQVLLDDFAALTVTVNNAKTKVKKDFYKRKQAKLKKEILRLFAYKGLIDEMKKGTDNEQSTIIPE